MNLSCLAAQEEEVANKSIKKMENGRQFHQKLEGMRRFRMLIKMSVPGGAMGSGWGEEVWEKTEREIGDS